MHALLRVSVRAMRPGIFRAPHQPLAPRRFEDIAIRCHPNAIANSRQTDAFIQLGFCYCTCLLMGWNCSFWGFLRLFTKISRPQTLLKFQALIIPRMGEVGSSLLANQPMPIVGLKSIRLRVSPSSACQPRSAVPKQLH